MLAAERERRARTASPSRAVRADGAFAAVLTRLAYAKVLQVILFESAREHERELPGFKLDQFRCRSAGHAHQWLELDCSTWNKGLTRRRSSAVSYCSSLKIRVKYRAFTT